MSNNCPIISSRGNHPRGKLCAMMIYPREAKDEYLLEDLEAIFDEFMEIVSSCPSSFIIHWAWNRGVSRGPYGHCLLDTLETPDTPS